MTANYISPAFGVKVERDVVYAIAPGYRSKAPEGAAPTMLHTLRCGAPKPLSLDMDIYLPEGDDAPARPLLLMMHGGSFCMGNKGEAGQVEWCRYFASLGYVAASINYRLGFHLNRNDVRQAELRALDDADAALSYLLIDRKDLRIDPQKVFAAGTSAGAITALNLAFRLYCSKPLEGLQRRLGHDFRICAIANLWGAVHDLSVLEQADVPILSFQSVSDPMVPYDDGYPISSMRFLSGILSDRMFGTHAIHQKALSIGLRSEHHPCQEHHHRLHMDDKMEFTPRFYEIRDAMARFFGGMMEGC